MTNERNRQVLFDFAAEEPLRGGRATHVMLSLKPIYLQRMRQGKKKYEYRRKFVRKPTIAFIYANDPVQAVCAKVEFDPPIIGPIEYISQIAESEREGGGKSILEYMAGLKEGYAIPVKEVYDIELVAASELKKLRPQFRPPQSYIILDNFPELLSFLLQRPVIERLGRGT